MTFSIRSATPAELDTLVAIDDDAARLYEQSGLHMHFPDDHPFAVAERESWRRSLERDWTFMAVDDAGTAVGFAALFLVDGAPYLDQLSVRLASMRQGLGRALLARAVGWARARGDALWLTTYGHLTWNRPFYEKEGFVLVPELAWGPEMADVIEGQRQVLPAPEQRVVMLRAL
jgi:GNAT superfamily N-acetyltransferase